MRAAQRNYIIKQPLQGLQKKLRASGFLFIFVLFVLLCFHIQALCVHIFVVKDSGQYVKYRAWHPRNL